nr:MAG TPA: hypothetical protein [Caudoviricetes sp.]
MRIYIHTTHFLPTFTDELTIRVQQINPLVDSNESRIKINRRTLGKGKIRD